MLDKTILVFYINADGLSREEVSELVESVRKLIQPLDEDKDKVIQYIIPVHNQVTKIECINVPMLTISEDEKKDVMVKIKNVDDKLDRITSYINAFSETKKVIVEKQFK